MPPICLPLSRVRTLGRSLWRSPARKHRWPATACHNGFVAWPAQSCSSGSAPILRASTKLDRFVILRCEFVFSLQDFVALLWSAQARLRLRAMEHFHPHQSGSKLSKLPHSKERGTVVDSAYHHVLAWRGSARKPRYRVVAVWRIHRRMNKSGGLLVNALIPETGPA